MVAAGEAIRAALAAGRSADAAKAFLAVVAERTKLTLEPAAWEGLGRALLAQGAYLEAAWALHAGAALAGDAAGAQKRLVEVALRAGDAGQAPNALKLYATLLAKYPQSQYADFVRANMKEQEKKVPKA
jgi:TolA-binding protein